MRTLDANGYRDHRDAVYVQSFEVQNLRQLERMTRVRLVQLVNCSGRPWDFTVAGDPRTYADMVTPAGLRDISRYADGIGVCKDVMIPRDGSGNLTSPTPVIADAHRRRLEVHGWTFRAENSFLPTNLRSSTDPTQYGDLAAEIGAFLAAGMDGFFTDHPDRGVAAVHERRGLTCTAGTGRGRRCVSGNLGSTANPGPDASPARRLVFTVSSPVVQPAVIPLS